MLMKVIEAPTRDEHARRARNCSDCAIREHALFRVLRDSEAEDAGDGIEHLRLRAGERIYLQGSTGTSLYTVREGIVRFERVTQAGDRRIVRLAGPSGLIGQEAFLQRSYADEAVACTPVQLCRIPKALLERLASEQPALYRELMQRWQSSLEAAEEWTTELTSGPSRRRVLKLLSQLSTLAGTDEPIWLPPRPEMGVMLGMAFETASRIVSQLRREGVLETFFPEGAWVDTARLAQQLQRENNRS